LLDKFPMFGRDEPGGFEDPSGPFDEWVGFPLMGRLVGVHGFRQGVEQAEKVWAFDARPRVGKMSNAGASFGSS
jgi:hypothetical protein